jgi:hypothetical protein
MLMFLIIFLPKTDEMTRLKNCIIKIFIVRTLHQIIRCLDDKMKKDGMSGASER